MCVNTTYRGDMRIGNFQLNRCKDLRSCTDYCNIHPRPSRNACPSNLPDRDSNRPSRGLRRNGHRDGRWAVGRDHDCSHYCVDDDKRPHLFGKMRLRSRANSDNGIRWCRPDKWLRSDMDPIGIRRYRLDNRRLCFKKTNTHFHLTVTNFFFVFFGFIKGLQNSPV